MTTFPYLHFRAVDTHTSKRYIGAEHGITLDNGVTLSFSDLTQQPERFRLDLFTGKYDNHNQPIFLHDTVSFMDMGSSESGAFELPMTAQVIWDDETASICVDHRQSAESWEILDECVVIDPVKDILY